jgi:hypothetical protein
MNSFAVSNNTHVVLNQVGPAGLNNGGDYSTTTGKYTVPVAGTYIVSVFLYMYTDNTQSWQITVNDVQVAAYYANSSVIIGTDNCATFTQTLDCAVDDLIGFKNTAGGSRNLYAGNVGQCRFWGHFLG